MGKGRNNRHKKRRQEQSRKSKREQKKEKRLETISRKREEKKTKKKNQRKKQRRMSIKTDWWNSDSGEYFAVRYIKMAVSGRFLAQLEYHEYVEKLKEFHEKGVITDLYFLIFGKWNSKLRNRFRALLKEHKQEWAWNHLLFMTSEERVPTFLLDRIRSFKITHYVDMDKRNLTPIVSSNLYHDVKLFYWKKNSEDTEKKDSEDAIEEFRVWLRKHNPAQFNLYKQGPEADFIIQTGVKAETEKLEIATSEGWGNPPPWLSI